MNTYPSNTHVTLIRHIYFTFKNVIFTEVMPLFSIPILFVLVASTLHELSRIWLGHVLSDQETAARPEEGELSTDNDYSKVVDRSQIFNYFQKL